MYKNTIPNILTLNNLACGIMSIIMAFKGSINIINYKWSCFFIIIAAIMDRYDGKLARYLNASSNLGKELDSLADLVSFGIAPSILVFNLYNLSKFGIIGYLLILTFPLSRAYRLAKYNCSEFNEFYVGLPITFCGTFITIYSYFSLNNTKVSAPAIILLLSFSYLMVSNLKFKKV